MFNLFKKKSKKEQLAEKYRKLLAESHRLSTTNRALSDQKVAEADEVLKQMDALEKES